MAVLSFYGNTMWGLGVVTNQEEGSEHATAVILVKTRCRTNQYWWWELVRPWPCKESMDEWTACCRNHGGRSNN